MSHAAPARNGSGATWDESIPCLPFFIDERTPEVVRTLASGDAPALRVEPVRTLNGGRMHMAVPPGYQPTGDTVYDVIDPNGTSPIAPVACSAAFNSPIWSLLKKAHDNGKGSEMQLVDADHLPWSHDYGRWRGFE